MSVAVTADFVQLSPSARAAGIAFAARRVAAFAVDLVIVAAVVAVIGVALAHWQVSVGSFGHTVGLLVGALYFVPLESDLGSGRSIGKRLLGLHVRTLEGEAPTFSTSAIRYGAFAAPFLLHRGAIDATGLGAPAEFVLNYLPETLPAMAMLANVLLLVFNSPSRRLLHDLVAKTAVTSATAEQVSIHAPLQDWMITLVVAVPGVVLCFATVAVSVPPLRDVDLLSTHQAEQVIQQEPEFFDVNLSDVRSNAGQPQEIALRVDLARWPNSVNLWAAAVVERLWRSYPTAQFADSVRVDFRVGNDLLLYQSWQTRSVVATRAEWAEKIHVTELDRPSQRSRLSRPEVDVAVRAQVSTALKASQPVRDRVTRFTIEHGVFPTIEQAQSEPSLWTVTTAGARIGLGTGGSVDVTLVDGAYAGHAFSWVPIVRGKGMHWVCAHGDIPPEAFDEGCK